MAKETEQRAFVVLMNNAAQVLVCKRSMASNNGGQFGLPGGHLNEGESVEEGAGRETFEELGVEIDFATRNIVRRRVDDKRTLVFACMPDEYEFNLDPHEVESVHWMNWTDLFVVHDKHKSLERLLRVVDVLDGVSINKILMLLKGSWG